jgi:hypothetical protein
MIEEALKTSNESPAETARALLSFFSQEFPLGGEARFVRFFPLLLDRVFGPVLSNALLRDHEFTAEELKSLDSAWLLQSRAWKTSFSLASSGQSQPSSYSPYGKPHQSSSSVPKIENDPVVQLLSTSQTINNRKISHHQTDPSQLDSPRAPSFFQVLSCSSDFDLQILPNARSAFLFSELPRSVQRVLIHTVQNLGNHPSGTVTDAPTSSMSTNGTQLLECISIQPLQQKDMVQTLRQIISIRQFSGGNGLGHGNMSPSAHSPSAMRNAPRSPLRVNQQLNGGGGQVQDVLALEKSLKLNLPLWEHYFMAFIRFPLLIGKMSQVSKKNASGNGSVGYGSKRNNSQPYGEKVYMHLLKDYIKYYFSHEFDAVVAKRSDSKSELTDSKKDQALIRMMMEYWLEKHAYSSTKDAMMYLSSEGGNIGASGLQQSYDLAQLLTVGDKWGSNLVGNSKRQMYEAPPRQVQRCIKIAVDHLVCDPAITKQCKAVVKTRNDAMVKNEWPLPSIQTLLQPSLFNYIRTALRYGPIHVANSSFYAAVDLWLLWIEPWNVAQGK